MDKKNMMLYFAYGSNMALQRMGRRCPGAVFVGPAVLKDYKIAERRYADIDYHAGALVDGILYMITDDDLVRLDFFEGAPKVYERRCLEVEFHCRKYQAVVYEMTSHTKKIRDRIPYSVAYRELCCRAAQHHNIHNNFLLQRELFR